MCTEDLVGADYGQLHEIVPKADHSLKLPLGERQPRLPL